MSEPLTLLRRERGRRRPSRRSMAFACAAIAIALAAPPSGSAGSVRPDPPSGPSSTGLQPDAFHDATVPKPTPAASTRVTPVQGIAALPALRGSPAKPSLTPPPTAPKFKPVTNQPSVATHPVVTAPAVPAVVTRHRVVHRHAKRHHAAPRLELPTTVSGSFAVPAILRAPAAPVAAVVRRRDLRPAALALLALVATSGCLLAVAARSRQERLGV
jgi:hypothetical protein